MKKLFLLFAIVAGILSAQAQSPCQAGFTYETYQGGYVVSFNGYAYNTDSSQINVTSWTWTMSNGYTLTGQNVTFQANSSSGIYYVCLQIQTDNGCSSTFCDSVIIGDVNPCNIQISGYVTPASTVNSSDGAIDITVYGATLPVTYQWGNGCASEDLTNIPYGYYEVTVTGSDTCSATQGFMVYSQDSFPVDTGLFINYIYTTNATVQGACDGTAQIEVSGGTPPYQFYMANGISSANYFENLCPGSYTVQIIDANGLSATATFVIGVNNIPGDSVMYVYINSGSDPNGQTCYSYAESVVYGGVAPYAYMWDNGATTPNIDNLCPGFYCVTVTDALGQTASACANVYNYSDSTNTIPGDTIYSQVDTCFTTMIIDSAFVGGINNNGSGIYVNWVLLINGDTVYFDQQYYIDTPGVYLITLIINCSTGGKDMIVISDIYNVTQEELTPTGIRDISNNQQLSLFPNPVNEVLNIESDKTVTSVTLYNSTGQAIYQANHTNRINVGSLAEGIYVVKIMFSDNTTLIRKIAK
ncbi:MAG: T9SS type A sorting domain-containing protein [Bacteroidia bacterium]|nr:T9SS type A sorting domain-containing protein [Bacteroidia bacterium]